MAANINPISPASPATSFNASIILAANTALDGTGTVGTNIGLVFTAGSNGARINRLRVVHRGSNVATAMRFFLNNGSSNAVATNNALLHEITVAVNTLSQTAASVFQDVPLALVLKPGWQIYYTIGTAVASGHNVSCPDAGDY